jgi:hypothetical protein
MSKSNSCFSPIKLAKYEMLIGFDFGKNINEYIMNHFERGLPYDKKYSMRISTIPTAESPNYHKYDKMCKT